MAELHRIVVGIDLGTTYSAVAWAETSRPDQIELVKNWPTSGQLVGSQTPTEIAYLEGDTTKFSWGYDISPRARKVKWFKLGLETGKEVLVLPPGLTVADVAKDFLSALQKHVMTTLYRRFDANIMSTTRVNFVLTVPAIWSDAAKQKTRNAAIKAGMGNEHHCELLSEPESAAIYTLKNLDASNSAIRIHDIVVICDAGGGTVDLISYEVHNIHPSLSVTECAPGTGDYCGSTFIDQEFERLFKTRMGNHVERLTVNSFQQVVKNFELCKVAFRNDPAIPKFYVNVPTIGDLEDAGIYGGMFEITLEEMQKLFEPVVSQVLELIRAQVMAVSTGDHRANSILLVGGFGESEYLFERVRGWANPCGIQVLQPREASTAIVRGAVIRGLEPSTGPSNTQIVRRARRSYGVPTNQAFIPGKHAEIDMHIEKETSEKLARNQISWIIRKDQPLADDQTFRHVFRRNFSKLTLWTDVLVSSSLDIPPTRWDSSVNKHCTITSDLISLSKKNFDVRLRHWKRYYTANYELVINVRNNNLTIWLEHNGKLYGVASVEFDQG